MCQAKNSPPDEVTTNVVSRKLPSLSLSPLSQKFSKFLLSTHGGEEEEEEEEGGKQGTQQSFLPRSLRSPEWHHSQSGGGGSSAL